MPAAPMEESGENSAEPRFRYRLVGSSMLRSHGRLGSPSELALCNPTTVTS